MSSFTGVPAFPVPNSANVNGQEGMTLRDYFAARALPIFLHAWGDGCNVKMQIAADASYAAADAMLKAREESNV